MARRPQRALTLIETMAVIAIVGVLLLLVVPSVRELIVKQRVRSMNDELITNLAFARTEAAARGQLVALRLEQDSDESCYTIAAFNGAVSAAFSGTLPPPATGKTLVVDCDCRSGAGSACSGNWVELRTVTYPVTLSVTQAAVGTRNQFGYDPATGAMRYEVVNLMVPTLCPIQVDTVGTPSGKLRASVGATGRTTVCSPDTSIPGVAATCPSPPPSC